MIIIKPGSDVYLHTKVNDTIHATILSVQINANGPVSYEVVWWDGSTRKKEWVNPQEISETIKPKKCQIGFANV